MNLRSFTTLLLLVTFWGCSPMQIHKTTMPPKAQLKQARIAVIPFYNYTQTPMAGYSAASVAGTVLKAHGYRVETKDLRPSPETMPDANALKRKERIAQLRADDFRYVLTGEVTEWRYKAGVDAEPVAGLVVTLIDTENGRSVYNAAGSRHALSLHSLSETAQEILESILP